jgi:hypothetical protein
LERAGVTGRKWATAHSKEPLNHIEIEMSCLVSYYHGAAPAVIIPGSNIHIPGGPRIIDSPMLHHQAEEFAEVSFMLLALKVKEKAQ